MMLARALRSAAPLALCALVAGAVAIAAPASAQEESALDCAGKNDLLVKPGIGATATSAASFQSATAGVLECEGTVAGKKATGPGQYAFVGEFAKDATCTIGSGKGLLRMIVGTDAGPHQIDAPFKFSYPTFSSRPGVMAGKFAFDNDDYDGRFEFTPTKGDCVQTPITNLRIFNTLDFVG
ncbi:MAG: hypothetical protein ACT4QF_10895 [Sporichthyaceae bacterium]